MLQDSKRSTWALLALAISAFAIGTTEFISVGLLPLIADDLGISVTTAGLTVTLYALGVTFGAPVLTSLTSTISRKTLLLAIMIVFIAGNTMAALSTGITMLLIARVVSALAHGVFMSIGSTIAADLVPANRRASAIAIMFSGLTLPVPNSIDRPEYAWKPTAQRGHRALGADARGDREDAGGRPDRGGRPRRGGQGRRPGITTDELDRIAHEFMVDHGAYPSTLGYKGYPKSCCTSLNEVICHGIPDSTVVEDGDIVNIDVTAYIDGVHGDTNATFLAGDVSEEHRLLVERTHEATMRAIKAVRPGRALSVVGRVIESYANRFGYNVVRDFTGHGIGTTFHNGLVVLHYDQPAVETIIEPGMTFTIEPMINLGALDYEIWDDDWTVVNTDGKWTAQFEHTLVVTDDGAEILTQL